MSEWGLKVTFKSVGTVNRSNSIGAIVCHTGPTGNPYPGSLQVKVSHWECVQPGEKFWDSEIG